MLLSPNQAPSNTFKKAKAAAETTTFVQLPGRDTLRGGRTTGLQPKKQFKSKAELAREGTYRVPEENEEGDAPSPMGEAARFPHSRGTLENAAVGSPRKRTDWDRNRKSLAVTAEAPDGESDDEEEEAADGEARTRRKSDEERSINTNATCVLGKGRSGPTRSSLLKGTTLSTGLKGKLLHDELEKDRRMKNEEDDSDEDDEDKDNDKTGTEARERSKSRRSTTMSELLAFVQAARNLRASVTGNKSQGLKGEKAALREERRKAAQPCNSQGMDAFVGTRAVGVLEERGQTLSEQRRNECKSVQEQYKKTLELTKSTPGAAPSTSSRMYLGQLALVPANENPSQLKACQPTTERRRAVEQQLHSFFRTYVANPPINIVCSFDDDSADPHCPRHVIVEFRSPEEAHEALTVCRRLGRTDGESHPPERVAWAYCGYAWGAEDFRPSHRGQGKSKKVPIRPSGAARRYNVPAYEEGPPLLLELATYKGKHDSTEEVEAPVAPVANKRRLTFSAPPPGFKPSYYGARINEGR